jgi:hypothetical protein
MTYFNKNRRKQPMNRTCGICIAAVGILMFSNKGTWAQATQAEVMERSAGSVSEKVTARMLAEDLLQSKGWKHGLNTNEKGDDFFVTIGTGDIQAALDNPNYLDSRANAYDKAALDAWRQIRQFVGETIQSGASSFYKEATGVPTTGEEPTVTEKKVESLLTATLDNLLRKSGVEPASATPEQKESALTSETFKKSASSLATGPIIGVQSYATFEGPGGGKGYQIAVVAVWSEKLQKLAESMLYGTAAPVGTPGKSAKDWIPAETSSLVCSFGVQMVRDEKGQPILLAYGQSRPVSESSRSVDAAYAKAFLEAKSQLRFFAGAQAKVLDDLQKQETTDEYSDATKEYNSVNYFAQSTDVFAPPEKFSGISQVKSWTYIHPITKKQMAGVIAMWSPESALVANRIGARMSSQPKGPAATTRTPSPIKRTTLDASDQGMTGSGATGSDDF